MNTSPAPSTATPRGPLIAGPRVSATNPSPVPSTATPTGDSFNDPFGKKGGRGMATVGVKVGLVEYWSRAVVVEPFGLTVALSVAPVAVTELAAPVATVGA